MRAILYFFEQHYRKLVLIFFISYFLLGLLIFRDYGVSWDEHLQRITGVLSLKFVFEHNPLLLVYPDRYYGPVYEMLLVSVEKVFHLTSDPRAIYFMRHLVNFFVFYTGVIFFYKLCRYKFASWKFALLGCLFLLLSPRIFADSFYNSKDLPFLSVFIISIYTFIQFLNKRNVFRALIHAFVCAVLIDIRILGVMVPFLTILFLVIDTLKNRSLKAVWLPSLIYIGVCAGLTVLFWPALWPDPFRELLAAFKEMSHFPSEGTTLYCGEYVFNNKLPWHYGPVWLFVTSPFVYGMLFVVGFLYQVTVFIKRPLSWERERRDGLIVLLWFFLPLVAVIVFRSSLYDGWRQLYFIYPAFILVALSGLQVLAKILIPFLKERQRLWAKAALTILIGGNLAFITVWMIRSHPFQNVYFNRLAGKNLIEVKKRFEMDYWGLSYRRALEYILSVDKRSRIKVFVANSPGISSAYILPVSERERLQFVNDPRQAEYFLSNYRWHREEYGLPGEVYAVKVGGAKIMVVYKLM